MLKPGVIVCIHGLQADGHLNGLIGTCRSQQDAMGMLWAVELETGQVKSIGAENLVVSLGQTRVDSRISVDHFGPKIALESSAPAVNSADSAACVITEPAIGIPGGDEAPPGEPTLEEDPDSEFSCEPRPKVPRSDNSTSPRSMPVSAGVPSMLVGDNSPPVLSPAPIGLGAVMLGDDSPPSLSPAELFVEDIRVPGNIGDIQITTG